MVEAVLTFSSVGADDSVPSRFSRRWYGPKAFLKILKISLAYIITSSDIFSLCDCNFFQNKNRLKSELIMFTSTMLTVKNLHTYFYSDGDCTKAVKGVSFDLEKGETLGIVGESGSGKSVTALSILKLIDQPPGKIEKGEIVFNDGNVDTNLLEVPENQMHAYRGKHIAMIFQEPMTSLNPVMSCGDQVIEAILTHQDVSKSEAKQRVLSLFEEVLLPEPEASYNKYPHEISGGQKQRVMIAMALSCNPDVLIADEPTTALDVTVQKSIIELLQRLKEKRALSMIFISHDLGVIAQIADKIAVMYKGEIIEYGTCKEVLQNPKQAYTIGLLACRPPLDYKTERLATVDDYLNQDAKPFEEKRIKPVDTERRLKELASNKPLLEVKNLKSYYIKKKNFFGKTTEYFKAVEDVSFDIYPGETLGLVGESGCGKSTLGRTLIKLMKPHAGSVFYEGTDVLNCPKSQLKALRKKMQIIFQDPYSSLNPRMTIGQAIVEPMQVHNLFDSDNQRCEKAINLLEKVSLSAEHFNRYPHQFSGGQRQRICIARALAVEPQLIICDESVSALDVSVQASVINLLKDLQLKYNLTYLFISHDLAVVQYISDRILVMNEGKIVDRGTSEEIFKSSQNDFTRNLIDAIPVVSF